MDWVETTGRTIEEAIEQALVELGVSEDDADIVVLSEAKPGLFGRVRSEARVRARVRPTESNGQRIDEHGRRRASRTAGPDSAGQGPAASLAPPGPTRPARQRQQRSGASSDGYQKHEGTTVTRQRGESGESELEVPLAEQAEVAAQFLLGVLDRMGLSGRVDVTEIDEGTVEVAVTGSDLALLVGPRGATVDSLQDLARVVVQRRTGARRGRLLVDVAGYRQRRRQALALFTRERAEEVMRDGVEQVLEPMGAADRKVIHDTANSVEGVRTHSEGEEPRRRVVISPA